MSPFPGTIQIPIQFSGGLNSKIAEFSLDQPNLQVAENAIYNQYGQVDTRTGLIAKSDAILGGGNIDDGATITTFNEELILMDGEKIYSYDQDNDIWINRGILFSTINKQQRVINTKTATQSGPDATSLNGLQCYVYEDNRPVPRTAAGVRYGVLDSNTNAFIISDRLIYTAAYSPKLLAVPSLNQFNIYYEVSSSILFLQTISTNRPQILAPLTQVVSDGYSPNAKTFAYDVCLINNVSVGPHTYNGPTVAYASTNGLTIFSQNAYTVVDTSITAHACVAICPGGNQGQLLWIAYSNPTGVYVKNITTSVTTQIDTLPATNVAIIEDIQSGNLNITYEIAGAGNNPNYIKNAILTNGNAVISVGTQRKVGLASKPFRSGDNIFINTIFSSNLQATYFTQCLTQNFSVIAKHSPQNGGTYRTNRLLAQCDAISTDNFIFAGQRKGPFTSFQNAQSVNLGVAGYTINFSSTNAFNNTQANNNLHIVGGIKKIYDGISCVEDNFNVFPELPDGYGCDISLFGPTIFDPGGKLHYNPLTIPNQYQYLAVYEWTDNFGQVQRSSPSLPNTVIVPGDGYGATLTVPTLPLTDKDNARSPVIISIYRTQDSLPIFYKITDDTNPLVNDPTVDTLTFDDRLSDTDIAANENLYIGTQLPNIAPPSCSLISLYQNRIFVNQTEDPGVLWFSQNKFEQDQYNTLPLDFNTFFVEGVDSQVTNDITALGWLDRQLAIFKKTSIFTLDGDGPNALDTSGQFNDATILVTDTGCNNPNSLVFITQTPKLPGGLLFKSDKGIYLLGRDTSLYYIGAMVEKYNDLTITSANLLAKSNQVVFTTLEGTALVYNYYLDTWTTWTNLPAVNATVWQNKLVILTANGRVMIQDDTNTVYQDDFGDGVVYPVQRKVTTPWINVAGKQNSQQGFQCVYNCLILGTLKGAHILQVEVSYDYNPTIAESVLINSSVVGNYWGGLPTWANPGVWGDSPQFSNYQFQINFKNFRSEAIQLTFTDLNPEATAGFSLNGLVLEALPLPGPYRLPLSNKVAST